MKVEVERQSESMWQKVKNLAMRTIGKDSGKAPSTQWKTKILLAEHSPIRSLKFYVTVWSLKYWISVHLVRHKTGIEHYVSTQRTDRTGVERDDLPQKSLVSHTMDVNAQALIYMARKRLCNQAAAETVKTFKVIKEEIAKYEPELASVMVRECVYRGFCPEMKCCGYVKTEEFRRERLEYASKGVMPNGENSEV